MSRRIPLVACEDFERPTPKPSRLFEPVASVLAAVLLFIAIVAIVWLLHVIPDGALLEIFHG